jgi:hypothetical protein
MASFFSGTRTCSACEEEKDRGEYSNNQWGKGVESSRCSLCVRSAYYGGSNPHWTCAACGITKDSDEYSSNQWNKGWRTRCRSCVELMQFPESDCGARRSNESSKVNYLDKPAEKPWQSGSFRNVYRARYCGGPRHGQYAVVKMFQSDHKSNEDWLNSSEEKVTEKAISLVSKFNEKGIIGDRIMVNECAIWDGDRVEPFIHHYRKFNSNSGWASRDSSQLNRVMQALSHFTYHVSGGNFLLCDLQGGAINGGAILTDPTIQSRTLGGYGPTDLGVAGISSFFQTHECNEYCREEWTSPRHTEDYFDDTCSSTSMIKLNLRSGDFTGVVSGGQLFKIPDV